MHIACEVEGNTPHLKRRGDDEQSQVPRISFDYFFMSWEDEAAHRNPMLVMKDEATGEKYARAVGQKGLGQGEEMQWLIADLHEELKSWGAPRWRNGTCDIQE